MVKRNSLTNGLIRARDGNELILYDVIESEDGSVLLMYRNKDKFDSIIPISIKSLIFGYKKIIL
jgi:hypothetical protein